VESLIGLGNISKRSLLRYSSLVDSDHGVKKNKQATNKIVGQNHGKE
jgi:hypothetical protein